MTQEYRQFIRTEKNILATRPIPAALISKAAGQGISITVLPFVQVKLLNTAVLKDKVKALSACRITAVFTSSNGVAAIRQLLPFVPREWSVACLDGKTREVAAALLGEEAIVCTAPDAGALAAALVEGAAAESLIFFCGNRRLDRLPEVLKAAGKAPEEVIVYETIGWNHKVIQGYDGIMFFSPSAAESFFTGNTISAEVPLFAIGATTAESLQQYTNNTIVISPEHNASAMVEQIIGYFNL